MQYVRVTILALLAAVCLNAREVTAGIYIVVQDSTSAAVPNVAVALHNVNTGRDYPAISECCVDHPAFYQLGRELYLGQNAVRPTHNAWRQLARIALPGE